MKTLLRVPDLLEAVGPINGRHPEPREVFALIGGGVIQPFGYVLRAPVFLPEQVTTVRSILSRMDLREAAPATDQGASR
ncbi:MAG: hypothetical protein RBR19_14440 [Sedimentisphaerales bacterium]|jgi:hypothetical protein|nr:hypothetical protein [Sedimentisphaerales bacterium]